MRSAFYLSAPQISCASRRIQSGWNLRFPLVGGVTHPARLLDAGIRRSRPTLISARVGQRRAGPIFPHAKPPSSKGCPRLPRDSFALTSANQPTNFTPSAAFPPPSQVQKDAPTQPVASFPGQVQKQYLDSPSDAHCWWSWRAPGVSTLGPGTMHVWAMRQLCSESL